MNEVHLSQINKLLQEFLKMHIYEIITESKNNDQLDELTMAQVGRGAAKVAKGVATGVGAVAGGLAGAGKAFMKGFRKGKDLVGGDDSDEVQPATSDVAATSPTQHVSKPTYTSTPTTSNATSTAPIATKTSTNRANMKVIKSSIQALPRNQRAQIRKIVAAKAGVA